ncbi:MAG: hypothetical protein CMF50_04275 [Legionellales bacterium]|nr:hypothetical protein [Legionellales bacterium]|tara:strand:- start:12421 stop:12873 length:453 start_codon:yes stop_codon:yes gene_type:complete
MRVLILVLFTVILLAGCGSETRYQDTSGKTITQTSLKGHWVVINYWAPWCHSCIEEIPELNRFSKNHSNIQMLGVDYDGATGERLNKAIAMMGINYPVLTANPQADWQLDKVSVLPTTFVINPEGNVVKTIVGPTRSKDLAQIVTTNPTL